MLRPFSQTLRNFCATFALSEAALSGAFVVLLVVVQVSVVVPKPAAV